MKPDNYAPCNGLLTKDTFRFIKPDEYESLGIDPEDIPIGTFPALKHPSHLPSRFGGNAYGWGLFEIYDRLKPDDIKLLQEVSFNHPEHLEKRYKLINRIYKKMGLLMRVSRTGKPYYLIPAHLVSNTLEHIRVKLDEICRIIESHRKKFLKERYSIGLLTLKDDLIFNELSYRFREHHIVLIDSLSKLRAVTEKLDLMIITRDIYELLLLEDFAQAITKRPSKSRLNELAHYLLWKIHGILRDGGELFVVADRQIPKTDQTALVTFKTEHEAKNFILFTHIFKTQQRYRLNGRPLEIKIFDLQEYLRGFYVEPEIIDRLLNGADVDTLSPRQINDLPYLDYPLRKVPYSGAQEKAWARLFGTFFEQVFFKSIVPEKIKQEWESRFSIEDYEPQYMLVFLGQRKDPHPTREEIMNRAEASKLLGSAFDLIADYRDSFAYVIDTLVVLDGIRKETRKGYPELLVDRLRQPLENKRRRHPRLGHVLKLAAKIPTLKRLEKYLNPEGIEGPQTKVLKNLDAFSLMGLPAEELVEIVLIVAGHTPMGRILSGKVNEKGLQPVTDKARGLDPLRALNLLRYCRLMTFAELEASQGQRLSQEQIRELFTLYESAVRIVLNRDIDWDRLLDEKIAAVGGIHNEIISKLLKMMNYYEFLDTWRDLKDKGPMEKEALADYDPKKIARVDNVIKLIDTIAHFERRFLKGDPFELASFYRKLLNVEFHGTGRIFSRLNSKLIFVFVWLTSNVLQNEGIINLNPMLARLVPEQIDEYVNKIEKEGNKIKIDYLDLPFLRTLAEQLHDNRTTFIVGTGFQLHIQSDPPSVELDYVDLDRDIERLSSMLKTLASTRLAEWPIQRLKELEELFFDLESFYQSHRTLLSHGTSSVPLPASQTRRYKAVSTLKDKLRSQTLRMIFDPEHFYTHLNLLYRYAPTLLRFVVPEFMALEDLDLSGNLYLRSPVTYYILKSAQKVQALILKDRASFQDQFYLHQLAQREFGPMAAGTIGVNELQLEQLEHIMETLRANTKLFDAFLKSFLYQDIARIPALRTKYAPEINPADLSEAAVTILEREDFGSRYQLDDEGLHYVKFLVKNHDLIHHIIRGEFHFDTLNHIIRTGSKELLDALFLFSLIMISAIREDLIVEDLAQRLFRVREICIHILGGKSTFGEELKKIHLQRGKLFHVVSQFLSLGPQGRIQRLEDLESIPVKASDEQCIRSGRMVFAMERLFRLRGIRYIEFEDMARFMMKIPIRYVYKKRAFSSIGYPTFEKELFEAFRIYNTMQNLAESVRHTILEHLSGDKVRIFGYEKVSGYLSYENQIKLLLVTLLGTKKLKGSSRPFLINFLPLSRKIDRRYEALNYFLNSLSVEKIWNNSHLVPQLFKAKKGLLLEKDSLWNVINVDFKDRIDIEQKINYMNSITNLDQLKNYYYYSLRSLRKYPFNTEDYEKRLEKAYEKRMKIITDTLVKKFQEQMQMATEFSDLHEILQNLLSRSYDTGFSSSQRQHIQDLYELRKEELVRDKLREIKQMLDSITDRNELEDYWNSIKWYLLENRAIVGKEFESLVARQFDKRLMQL